MAEVKFDIGEGEIRNAIAVSIADAFSPERKDAMFRDLIRAHLQYKENQYDKETLLSKTVGKQIEAIAIEELGKMFAEKRPVIAELVRKTLGPSFMDNVCLKLENALKHVVVKDINIDVNLDRD